MINKLIELGFYDKYKSVELLAHAIVIKQQNPLLNTNNIYKKVACATERSITSVELYIRLAIKKANNEYKTLTNTQAITILAKQLEDEKWKENLLN
jgi:hypothetical protein